MVEKQKKQCSRQNQPTSNSRSSRAGVWLCCPQVEGAHNAMEVQLYHEENAFFLQAEGPTGVIQHGWESMANSTDVGMGRKKQLNAGIFHCHV